MIPFPSCNGGSTGPAWCGAFFSIAAGWSRPAGAASLSDPDGAPAGGDRVPDSPVVQPRAGPTLGGAARGRSRLKARPPGIERPACGQPGGVAHVSARNLTRWPCSDGNHPPSPALDRREQRLSTQPPGVPPLRQDKLSLMILVMRMNWPRPARGFLFASPGAGFPCPVIGWPAWGEGRRSCRAAPGRRCAQSPVSSSLLATPVLG